MPVIVLRFLFLAGVIGAMLFLVLRGDGPSLPDGVTSPSAEVRLDVVLDGLDSPVAVGSHSSGGLFVADRAGRVMYHPANDTVAPLTIDLTDAVHSGPDSGVIDLVAVPGAGVTAVYVLYLADAPPGQTPPYWNDSCVLENRIVSGCVLDAHIARIDFDAQAGPTSRLLLDDLWCVVQPNGLDGALAVDTSGNLLIAFGDGASSHGVDDGSGDVDYAAADSDGCSPTGEHLGAFRAREAGAPDSDGSSLNGTVVRYEPTTGIVEVLAYGLHRPTGLSVDQTTGDIWLLDRGWRSADEINMIPGPTTDATDFGWPCAESGAPTDGYAALAMCRDRRAETDASTQPMLALRRDTDLAECDAPSIDPRSLVLTSLARLGAGSSMVWTDPTSRCVFFAPATNPVGASPSILLKGYLVADMIPTSDGLLVLHVGTDGEGSVVAVDIG